MYIHIRLFPANLGDSACSSEIVQVISAVRQFGGRSGMIRQSQCRNWLRFYRITCRLSKIGRKRCILHKSKRETAPLRILKHISLQRDLPYGLPHSTNPVDSLLAESTLSSIAGFPTVSRIYGEKTACIIHVEVVHGDHFAQSAGICWERYWGELPPPLTHPVTEGQ